MASIELCGVSKVFRDGSCALQALDLEVRSGELLVLMGPSGSGKTTTLRMIAGLEEPSSGAIRLDGRELRGLPPRRRNIAMVFQGLGLYGHWTARQNLTFGLRMQERGWLGATWERWFSSADGQTDLENSGNQKHTDEGAAVRWVADLLGIDSLLEKRPAELSGGEQQRVAIGRALVRRPAVFLFDEPLANLDGPTRLILRREVKRLQRVLGVTTIYVTHDQAEALALGDRIAVLHAGRLQQIGTPAEVYRQPANRQVASLFGLQGMNFLTGTVGDEGQWTINGGEWRVHLPTAVQTSFDGNTPSAMQLGIRPEDVRVTEGSNPQPSCWQATVQDIEFQGAATYLHLRPAGPGESRERDDHVPTLTGRWANETPPPDVGSQVNVNFEEHKLCWFDAAGINRGIQTADSDKK